ncbi:UNVERIFIED_CONTAM: hypothetical protein Sradi_2982100 [Sesamum radiatum]|uniref:CCHC-type domain-containing protein n=1 Tax=Sesamum radiatum TaxID=300843 RepID=A0AAW2S2K1_SESRA
MHSWRITKDRFCVKFNHRLDMKRALDGRPWVFDKNLVLLETIGESENTAQVCLDWNPFNVFVHDIPLSHQTKNVAELIGNKISQFLEVELHETGHRWTSAWKLWVAINANSPLIRALRLRTGDDNSTLVSFSYDRLPNFCYSCGKLGQISKFCPMKYEDNFVESDEPRSMDHR